MPSINDYRNKFPSLRELDDDSLISRVAEVQGVDREDVIAHMGYKPKSRNIAAVANDTVIETANALAGGVKSVADFVSPGSALSSFIDEQIIKPGEANQSNVVKGEKARYRSEMESAEGIGDEIGSTLGYVYRNPLQSLAQAAGSFALPGAAVKGGGLLASLAGAGTKGVARGGLAGGAVAGAALSGGDAAGTAYELVKKAGGSEDEATEAARKASVLPAAIGAAGGVIGAERLLAGAGGFKGGMLSQALKTAGVEGAQEAVEEGVTQYEGQRAAMPYDATIDPMKGVAGAATMGAALGAATGGGVSLLTGKREQAKAPDVADVLAAPSIDDAIGAATAAISAPAAPALKPRQANAAAADELAMLESADRAEALSLMQMAERRDVSGNVRRYAQNRLDELLAPVRQIPTGEAAELQPDETINADVAFMKFRTPEQIAADGMPALPTGEATEFDAIPAGEATELEPEVIQPTDLLAKDGEPFIAKTGAQAKAYASGGGRVVAIPNHFGDGKPGYVVRPLVQGQPNNTRGPNAGDLPKARNVTQPDVAGTAGLSAGAADGRAPDGVGSGGNLRPLPDVNAGVRPAAPAPEQRGGEVAPAGSGSQPNAALTPGATVTLQGRDWQVKDAKPSAVILTRQKEDGGTESRVIKAGTDNWNAIQGGANEVAQPTNSGGVADAAATTDNPMLDNPASWVIREKATGKVVMETFDKAKVNALNTAKYEAVPAAKYLGDLNKATKDDAQPTASPERTQETAPPAAAQAEPAAAAARPADLQTIGLTPKGGEREAPPSKSTPDSRMADAKLLSDAVNADSFRNHGLRSLDIPSNRVVMGSVVRLLDDDKIAGRVVQLVPIDVMHILAGEKITPEHALRNGSVLKNLLAIDAKSSVPALVDAADSLVRVVARAATEQGSMANSAGRYSVERDSAGSAGNSDLAAEVRGLAGNATEGSASLGTRKAGGVAAVGDTALDTLDDRQVNSPTRIDELGSSSGATNDGPTTVRASSKSDKPAVSAPEQVARTPKAQAVKEALAATHKDPGEPAEAVTPAVVREAIKTGVQATDRKPSAMKAELLAKIDEAVKDAPDYMDFQAVVKTMGLKDATAVFTDAKGTLGDKAAPQGYSRPTLRFKIEGDGMFIVNNTVRQLLTFRAKVEASPGFRDRQAPAGLNERATDTLDRRSADAAIANMLDEGDFQAALDYAQAKGVDMANVKLTKVLRDRLDKWEQDQASAKRMAEYQAANPPAPAPEPAPAAEPEADDIPEAGIASQTFEQWAKAQYAGNEYKAKYLEEFGGDEKRATLGAAVSTIDNDRTTSDLLKAARAKYHGELLDLPRETSISLEVWDALDNMAKTEAQRHFFDLDRRITRRTQDETKARVEAETAKKAPYEAAFAEVYAEVQRLDKIDGPVTQKQKDLSARLDRLREAIYQIGQGKEPDGRLLRKDAAEPQTVKESLTTAPAEPTALTVEAIPKTLQISIEDGKGGTKLVNARKAYLAASQRVEKLRALAKCLKGG